MIMHEFEKIGDSEWKWDQRQHKIRSEAVPVSAPAPSLACSKDGLGSLKKL